MALDIKYNGNVIGSLSQDGTIIATTALCYCEDDLTVECTDSIFTPMPPDESYKREVVYQDTTKFPSSSNSITFQETPIITIRQRNIPTSLDKTKFTYEAYRVDDTAHTENLIDSITQSSNTQVNIVYSVKYASQLTDNTVFLCYYDGVKVFEYLMSFGGYIRVAWNLSTPAMQKLYRAFWAYALAAKDVFG